MSQGRRCVPGQLMGDMGQLQNFEYFLTPKEPRHEPK